MRDIISLDILSFHLNKHTTSLYVKENTPEDKYRVFLCFVEPRNGALNRYQVTLSNVLQMQRKAETCMQVINY